MALNLEAIRADFPILSRVLPSGRPLVYLDNAATTQKPRQVIQAMTDYYEQHNSNVHRAVHTLAAEATAAYEGARITISDWFGLEPHRLLFTSGTTEAINLCAHAWGRSNLEKGDVVLLTEMEHHSDLIPWQMLAKDIGVELRFVPVDPETYTLDMDAFEATIGEAKFVGCVHTSNVLGVRNPVERIIELAKTRGNGGEGAVVLLDSAQAVAHDRLGFDAMGADFAACSAHKMCGPTGMGALLVSEDRIGEMTHFLGGGDMIEEAWLDHATYQPPPHRFEAGTPKIAEAIGWAAAIDYLSQFDMDEVRDHILDLARHTAAQLKQIDGITVYGDHEGDLGSGAVSFLHDTLHSEDLAHFLDAGGFAVRTGHHCAQPLMRRLGISATNRASFYLYNTVDEADAFVTHLKGVIDRLS